MCEQPCWKWIWSDRILSNKNESIGFSAAEIGTLSGTSHRIIVKLKGYDGSHFPVPAGS